MVLVAHSLALGVGIVELVGSFVAAMPRMAFFGPMWPMESAGSAAWRCLGDPVYCPILLGVLLLGARFSASRSMAPRSWED